MHQNPLPPRPRRPLLPRRPQQYPPFAYRNRPDCCDCDIHSGLAECHRNSDERAGANRSPDRNHHACSARSNAVAYGGASGHSNFSPNADACVANTHCDAHP